MINKIRQHPWISTIITITIIVQVFELLLLIKKYGFFQPAFLQPYSIESFQDRFLFFTASLYGDIFLYSIIGLVFYFFTTLLKKSHLTSSYHFFFIVTTISLGSLLAKYKALSYMSDTINFTIAKNIAGGSLLSALNYVLDEAVIIIILLFLALITHQIGYKWLKRSINKNISLQNISNGTHPKHILVSFIFSLAFLIFFTTLVQYHNNVRYGVIRKNSYKLIINALDSVTDLDRDGYGYFSFPIDQAMFNSNIYPGAIDIPNNGVDEDMLLGDFQYTENPYYLDYSKINPNFDRVFFIVLESAREDLLLKKVNNHIVSPNINAISKTGTQFVNTYSHTGFTSSSLKAIFNGSLIFKQDHESLFEILKTVGYDINVFSGQAESFGGINKETNMRNTADLFFDAETNIDQRVYANTDLGSLRLSESTITTAIINYLNKIQQGEKDFFYINLQAAHFPYHYPKMPNLLNVSPIPRSKISKETQGQLEDTYWNAIANADNAIGKLINQLKKLNLYENSLFIITADHGESLFDDGVLGHGHKINKQQLKIPFVTNFKVNPITTPIGQTDMREIILDLSNKDQSMALTKKKLRDRDQVFHFIGNISKPVQISHTYKDDRIIFDFRTYKVMFEKEKKWMQINDLSNKEQILMLNKLIYEWEHLNYKQSKN